MKFDFDFGGMGLPPSWRYNLRDPLM